MKIKTVSVNNKAKRIEITSSKGVFKLPFGKLPTVPSSSDPIVTIFVDKELGSEAVTYKLQSGKEDAVHGDAFLDFNKDRDYLKKQTLHLLTVAALNALKSSDLTKKQVCEALYTSPSQLDRLLDPAFYGKTIDKMIELLDVLDCDVEVKVKKQVA